MLPAGTNRIGRPAWLFKSFGSNSDNWSAVGNRGLFNRFREERKSSQKGQDRSSCDTQDSMVPRVIRNGMIGYVYGACSTKMVSGKVV